MNTGTTLAVVGGLIAVALIVAYAVTRAPAPMVVAPSVMAAPAAAPRQERTSGLGNALSFLNTLASTGAALATQNTGSKNTTGLSGVIGGQK